MAALQASGIADLLTTSLNELGRLKFTDLMSDYQNTIALKRLMKKNKMTFDHGPLINFNAIVDHNNSARSVGLAAQDDVNINSVMITGEVPWRHVTWNWAYEHREEVMNSGPAKIVDLIKTRRIAAMGSAILHFERRFWRFPASTNTLDPYGLPYWVVKSATATSTNEGFNGSAQSGYTTVGGINPSTYSRWKNYAGPYTEITKEDLIRAMRRAMVYTDFMPLVDEIPTYNTGDDYGIYTNYAVLAPFEEALEDQNDNLGNDLASKDGKVLFRRVPVVFVKELDSDTTNPVYGINWGEFKTIGLRGWWMKETVETRVAGQHTVGATHTDCSFNWMCRNRRRNWVLSEGTTELS